MAEINAEVEVDLNVQVKQDMNLIRTRAETYQRITSDLNTSETSHSNVKTRKMNFIKCKEHYQDSTKDNWSTENTNCMLCVKFVKMENPKTGILPRNIDILNMSITKKNDYSGQRKDAIRDVAELASIQWISCNVYPMSLSTVQRHAQDLFDTYCGLKKFSRKTNTYWEKCTPFLKNLNNLFDVAATVDYRKVCEIVWGVKMNSEDHKFYQNQCQTPPIGYCTFSVDRNWLKHTERLEKRSKRCRDEYTNIENVVTEEQLHEENEIFLCSGEIDPEFKPEDESTPKKKKYEYIHEIDIDDELPFKYRHLRSSLRGVRAEVYQV